MNFLQLTRKAIKLSGARLDLPESVSGAKGLASDFFDYVKMAWSDLQRERPDFYFRVTQAEIDLSEPSLEKGQKVSRIQIPPVFGRSFNHTALYDFYIQKTDNPNDAPTALQFIPWNFYSDRSELKLDYNESILERARPRQFTVAPDGNLWVLPIPDAQYTLRLFGTRRIQELCHDCDEPFLPEEYRDMIIWRAIRDYAMYVQDNAMIEKARARYMPLKKALDSEYLTQITLKTDTLYS